MNNIYTKLFNVKQAGITLQRDTKAFNYKYATLDQIQSKLNPIFTEQKLLVIHQIKDNQVLTQIRNIENEEYVESSIPMSEGTKPQDKGSEITYYRRYNLLSLLDLEVEDDDGKQAQDSKPKEEVKWYNDVDKNIDKWGDMVADGTTTPKAIIDKIEAQGFKLSAKNKEQIMNLG